MHLKLSFKLCLTALATASLFAADIVRNWQTGTLVETEKEQVRQGSTKTTNSEFTTKNKRNKTDYEENSRTTKTDDYDNFQVYTIQGDGVTYISRERLLFPWSKPASVTVGSKLKFAVEKNTMYIVGEDGKQHKAGVQKATMNADR